MPQNHVHNHILNWRNDVFPPKAGDFSLHLTNYQDLPQAVWLNGARPTNALIPYYKPLNHTKCDPQRVQFRGFGE